MNKSEQKLTESGREKETSNQIHRKSSYTGRTPKEMMRKHIQDKNDVITDEDFYNLNISLDISNDTAHPVLIIPDDEERPKDEDKDPAIIIPWDLIKND